MNLNGGGTEIGWQRPRTSTASTMTPVVEPTQWGDRKVTPLAFLGIIALCGAAGFAASIGACAFVASVIAKRAQAALGDAFNLDNPESG